MEWWEAQCGNFLLILNSTVTNLKEFDLNDFGKCTWLKSYKLQNTDPTILSKCGVFRP